MITRRRARRREYPQESPPENKEIRRENQELQRENEAFRHNDAKLRQENEELAQQLQQAQDMVYARDVQADTNGRRAAQEQSRLEHALSDCRREIAQANINYEQLVTAPHPLTQKYDRLLRQASDKNRQTQTSRMGMQRKFKKKVASQNKTISALHNTVQDLQHQHQASEQKLDSLGKILHDIKGHLECPICLDTLNSPVMLDCTHAFCDACISKMEKRRWKCPCCRAQSPKRVPTARPLDQITQAVRGMVEVPNPDSHDGGPPPDQGHHGGSDAGTRDSEQFSDRGAASDQSMAEKEQENDVGNDEIPQALVTAYIVDWQLDPQSIGQGAVVNTHHVSRSEAGRTNIQVNQDSDDELAETGPDEWYV